MQELSDLHSIVSVLAGIIISLVLPVAVRILKKAKLEGLESTRPSVGQRIRAAWDKYGGNRYLMIFAAATLVAGVLIFLFDLKFYTVRDGALAGFAWESLLNKLTGGQGGDNS